MGEYDAETTTYSNLAGGAGTSPFTPSEDGILKAIKVMLARGAATALVNHVNIKLTCSTFKPNSIEVFCNGSGLQTAPAFQPESELFPINQRVKAGVPITMEGKNITADTPVGVQVLVYGYFE